MRKTYPPLAPEVFGGAEHAGVQIVSFEDDEHGWGALGHVEPERMVDAVLAHMGDAWGAERLGSEDVRHLHAVVTEPDPWVITWDGITAETPGAFPITLVVI